MRYHTQKLRKNEDVYNICSGKIGTSGKCENKIKTLKQIKSMIEAQQQKGYTLRL